MKTYLLILIGTLCTGIPRAAYAEEPASSSDANIIGHVTDRHTDEHLPFIHISLKGTTIGTMTDETGHYFLKNLPEGDFTVEVHAVGYKTVRRNVALKKGVTVELNF